MRLNIKRVFLGRFSGWGFIISSMKSAQELSILTALFLQIICSALSPAGKSLGALPVELSNFVGARPIPTANSENTGAHSVCN